jgi:hypothetical protein
MDNALDDDPLAGRKSSKWRNRRTSRQMAFDAATATSKSRETVSTTSAALISTPEESAGALAVSARVPPACDLPLPLDTKPKSIMDFTFDIPPKEQPKRKSFLTDDVQVISERIRILDIIFAYLFLVFVQAT